MTGLSRGPARAGDLPAVGSQIVALRGFVFSRARAL